MDTERKYIKCIDIVHYIKIQFMYTLLLTNRYLKCIPYLYNIETE